MADSFLGEIRIVCCSFPPEGWYWCSGQQIEIGQHSALYSVFGTDYGGDGRNYFNLPDLRERTPMGQGNGPGLTAMQVGQSFGEASITLEADNTPIHWHQLNAYTPAAVGTKRTNRPSVTARPTVALSDPTPSHPNGALEYAYSSSSSYNTHMSPAMVGFYGAGEGHENRQPFLVVGFVLSLDGEYPVRS